MDGKRVQELNRLMEENRCSFEKHRSFIQNCILLTGLCTSAAAVLTLLAAFISYLLAILTLGFGVLLSGITLLLQRYDTNRYNRFSKKSEEIFLELNEIMQKHTES